MNNSNYPHGKQLSMLAFGRVKYTDGKLVATIKTFDKSSLTVSYESTGEYHMKIPTGWFSDLNNCMINCTVVADTSDANFPIAVVPVRDVANSTIQFRLYDDGNTRRNGSFEFFIYPLTTWY